MTANVNMFKLSPTYEAMVRKEAKEKAIAKKHKLAAAKELWEKLGNIPVNENDEIEEQFLDFPIGPLIVLIIIVCLYFLKYSGIINTSLLILPHLIIYTLEQVVR